MHRPGNVKDWGTGYYFRCGSCGTEWWKYTLTFPQVDPDGLAICGTCWWSKGEPRLLFCWKHGDLFEYTSRILEDGATRYPHCRREMDHGAETCDHCGTSLMQETTFMGQAMTFKGGRPDRRYCSTRCRVAAHRARRRVTDTAE